MTQHLKHRVFSILLGFIFMDFVRLVLSHRSTPKAKHRVSSILVALCSHVSFNSLCVSFPALPIAG
jgi:hypothetical protein